MRFSISVFLNLCISQLVFFSISAIWGRHRQLDDSLVGQLTTRSLITKIIVLLVQLKFVFFFVKKSFFLQIVEHDCFFASCRTECQNLVIW